MKPEMTRGKLIASVLLILIGFCAGVGMSLLPVETIVRGAPGDPNPALKSVAHDATLAGDGTSSAPLAIANRGVTAPKLSAATPPSEGQLLGFNGANLAWQDAPVGGVRVVDSLGQVVGPLVQSNLVLRQIGPVPVQIRVSPEGIVRSDFQVAFVHVTSDCSGPRYFAQEPADPWRRSHVHGAEVFYAAHPLEEITMRSLEVVDGSSDPNQPGRCSPENPPFALSAGALTKFDLSTLGLVPPFHLEF
ncbi:MAG: hypothetical protein HY316_01260 [Acidobacteria bacterium]|nr:hypothetical protein [Acidobacteriota bacterium]